MGNPPYCFVDFSNQPRRLKDAGVLCGSPSGVGVLLTSIGIVGRERAKTPRTVHSERLGFPLSQSCFLL
jgi:hypothetical protein